MRTIKQAWGWRDRPAVGFVGAGSVRRAAVLALLLLVTACGGAEEVDGGDAGGDEAASAPAAEPSEAASAATAACDPATLPLEEDGTLTVATGEPVFEPWMVDDDPSNGEGYESALVYALADEMGLGDAVTWVRTGFDEAIAPGEKPYDFNIQQYSITAERDEVVDFSDGYYQVEQALVAADDSPIADATSIADLRSARLGAAIATTSVDYAEEVIQPEQQVQVFDDNAAAKAAFDAGQVDGLVFDLPTAYFVTAVEMPDAAIVGVLPRAGASEGTGSEGTGGAEELGMLFEEGSELVPCVNAALQALRDDGTLAQLEERWLSQAGDIPTLTN